MPPIPKEFYKNVTVIIPTYNEEKNISTLLGLINRSYPGISIIVADDGSSDNTQGEVKSFAEKINLAPHPYPLPIGEREQTRGIPSPLGGEGQGEGGSVTLLDRSNEKIKGLTASVIDALKQTKTDYFVVMDGDLQHPPEYIRLITERLSQKFDVVVALRDCPARRRALQRTIAQKAAAFLGRARLFLRGIIIEDPASGFFGGKTGFVLELIDKKEKRFVKRGYKILFDILKTMPKDTACESVRFELAKRTKGHSKMNFRIGWSFIKSLLT